MNHERSEIKCIKISLLACIFFTCRMVMAAGAAQPVINCVPNFTNPLQSNTAGKIVSLSGTNVLNNINNPKIPATAGNVFASGAYCSATSTPSTTLCTASGTVAPTFSVGTFQDSSGVEGNASGTAVTLGGTNNAKTDYNSVSVSGGTLNFTANTSATTVYRITTLSVNASTINFKPGNYWLGNLSLSGSNIFAVSGTGSVNLFVKNTVSLSGVTANSSGGQFLIYGFSDVSISGSTVNALIYGATGTMSISGSSVVSGAVSGPAISVSGSTLNYNANFVNTVCGGIDTFTITPASSTANFCQPLNVTVAAQNASNQQDIAYGGQITIDATNGVGCPSGGNCGSWSKITGAGTLTNTTSGVATYQFVAGSSGDGGDVVLAFTNPANASFNPVTFKVIQSNPANPLSFGVSGPVTYMPSSFLITNTVPSSCSSSPTFPNQIAGTPFNMYITACSSSCGGSILSCYSGTKQIKLWSNYVNPSTGTLTVTKGSTAIGLNSSVAAQSVSFTNGVAKFDTTNSQQMRYKDVGSIKIFASDTGSGISGNTGTFVVIPARLQISSIKDLNGNANPAASNATGLTFLKAGAPFSVIVNVLDSQGALTPNFGKEATPQDLTITSNLVSPTGAGTSAGSIGTTATSGPNFAVCSSPCSAGQVKGNITFSEVGIITLTPANLGNSYLAASTSSVIKTPSGNVGRFYPDHFLANAQVTPIFASACNSGGFTYLDQPFRFQTPPRMRITAYSLLGNITQNYQGSYWKLSASGFGPTYNRAFYPATTPNLILDAVAATVAAVGFTDNLNGTGDFTFSDGGGITLTRKTSLSPVVWVAPTPPFAAEIQLKITTIQDSDGVGCSNCAVGCGSGFTGAYCFGNTNPGGGISFSGSGGGKTFYFGRITVSSNSGSEKSPLSVPIIIERFAAGSFITNSLEIGSCTAINSSNISLSNFLPSPAFNNATTAGVPSAFLNGISTVILSAPNLVGSVNLTAILTVLPWLQYDWANTESYNSNPAGLEQFGLAPGNKRIIYEREMY